VKGDHLVDSTATTTKFCGEWLGRGERRILIDGNEKIACDGTYEDPAPNAISLVHKEDCPGSTETCRRDCYVHGLKAAQPDLFAAYQENSRTIREILADDVLSVEWVVALADWVNRNARGGFRWHVSGDVLDRRHARWIQAVCHCAPEVTFWIYTRTFSCIPALVEAPNLVVNVSADWDNYHEARAVALRYGLRLCYYQDAERPEPLCLPDGSVIFPAYGLRGRGMERPTEHEWWRGLMARERRMVCPVDFFGKGRSLRCAVCRRCLRHPHERRG